MQYVKLLHVRHVLGQAEQFELLSSYKPSAQSTQATPLVVKLTAVQVRQPAIKLEQDWQVFELTSKKSW